MNNNYPTANDSSNDKLVICDTCGKAEWTNHIGNCYGQGLRIGAHTRRMREATPAEYEEGRDALKVLA